ncbi:hypothetical protein [Bacterioplanoides sp. SCSIO 12839]|uniref:hypothetical protein n=1 Tax=Bacterioplanoides sp. SCSIO 12839 TaxID=2829569 RepID=UPI0021021B58|nr:hypothetical protein [Bacterioplanoides sp. SCSIO 12839]UTW48209.1 hypothetical protein KFF03_16910 [Bacterioplanoides sp. SCSIO 12839]
MKKLIVTAALLPMLVQAADVVTQDQVVQGSQCVGIDCSSNESFSFDTVRLKENNLRMHFDDTSASANFPNNDWRFTFNDSSNGGANFFSIDDATGNKVPFKIEAGASNNAIYIKDSGNIGMGTNNPAVQLQVTDGNTPALRLEQDGSSGFTSQSWDVAGNETNFFVRDVSNGSKLPFRIKPGAPTSAIFIAADGDIGLETDSPKETLHIKKSGDSGIRMENTTASVGSIWRVYNQGDSGKLKFTDDETGSRTPLKLEKEGTNNLMRIGRSTTVSGTPQNSMVEISGTLKATYLKDDSGNVYKLSDIVSALNALGQSLPTYQ